MERKIKDYLSDLTPQSLLGDISHMLSLERYGQKITNRILWRFETKDPVIALTFDDGPHPSSTPLILETLAAHQVPATFFLVGEKVKNHPDLAKKIVRSGHEVGNHSYSHSLLSLKSKKKMRAEIEKTDQLLRGLNRSQPRFFRPPVGMFSRRLLDIVEDLGYKAVIGDVYPRDPHSLNKDKIIRRVMERTAPGSIIILHDGGNSRKSDRGQTVRSVKEIVPRLKAEGYDFLTLSKIFDTQRAVAD